MKKLISILMVLLILLLSGCTSASSGNNVSGSMLSGYENYYCYSAEEYNQFIEKWNTSRKSFKNWSKLPDNFVDLEHVPLVGTFQAFLQWKDFPASYNYTFVDSSNYLMYLDISHTAKYTSAKNDSTSKEKFISGSITSRMTNMIYGPANNKDIYTYTVIDHNGIEYYYDCTGYLVYTIWQIDGIEFRLSGQLESFKVPESCFDFYRLFSMDETEVKAALEEFKQLLNAK